LSGEISSLNPELRPKVKPNFTWENKGYESYINNGFRPPDPDSQVPGYWEYLTFNSDWMAKNYLGLNIRVSHIEGVFMDQQKELVTKKDHRTGEETPYYQKATPRPSIFPSLKRKLKKF
jgi:hypothetical protein